MILLILSFLFLTTGEISPTSVHTTDQYETTAGFTIPIVTPSDVITSSPPEARASSSDDKSKIYVYNYNN